MYGVKINRKSVNLYYCVSWREKNVFFKEYIAQCGVTKIGCLTEACERKENF